MAPFVTGFFCLTQCFKIHAFCSMYQCFIAFNSRILNIPMYECTSLCSSVHRFMSIWVVSPFDCCAHCCYEHLCTYFSLNTFSSFGYIPSSGITERSESVSCLVVSDSLRPYGLQPTNLSAHGVLQARILEWVVIPFCRGSSQPRG